MPGPGIEDTGTFHICIRNGEIATVKTKVESMEKAVEEVKQSHREISNNLESTNKLVNDLRLEIVQRISPMRVEVQNSINSVETGLTNKIAESRAAMGEEIGKLKSEIINKLTKVVIVLMTILWMLANGAEKLPTWFHALMKVIG